MFHKVHFSPPTNFKGSKESTLKAQGQKYSIKFLAWLLVLSTLEAPVASYWMIVALESVSGVNLSTDRHCVRFYHCPAECNMKVVSSLQQQ